MRDWRRDIDHSSHCRLYGGLEDRYRYAIAPRSFSVSGTEAALSNSKTASYREHLLSLYMQPLLYLFSGWHHSAMRAPYYNCVACLPFIGPMSRALLFPTLGVIADLLANEMLTRMYKSSNAPDIIYLLFLPSFLFFASQAFMLLSRDWFISTNDLIAGLACASLYVYPFVSSQTLDYVYSTELRLAIDAAGVVFASALIEILVGRKSKVERNIICMAVLLTALSALYIPSELFTHRTFGMTIVTLVLRVCVYIFGHILVIAYSPAKILYIGSTLVLMYAILHFSWQIPYETARQLKYLEANSGAASLLFGLLLLDVVFKYMTLAQVDLDIIYVFLCMQLVLYLILKGLRVLS
ncbi:hypothetical protein PAPHI01_2307 [Pancytospora philotis]|nr:hypothetical protein PAPHI01_2307 [Pancytospora philotis]